MDQQGADKGRHRRIFGSGVHAGLRLAGIQDTEGFMNQAKLKAVEQGLNGVAKKVLDALAYAEPRTPHEIGAELRRSGTAPDSRIISGCLLSLMSRGLVREPRPGYYLRIQVMNERAPKPDDHETAEASPPAAPVEPPKPELAERMAIVAGALREAANEIDHIAVAMLDRDQAKAAEFAKLAQLKALLASIGGAT